MSAVFKGEASLPSALAATWAARKGRAIALFILGTKVEFKNREKKGRQALLEVHYKPGETLKPLWEGECNPAPGGRFGTDDRHVSSPIIAL